MRVRIKRSLAARGDSCAVCRVRGARYTCPRCTVSFCSKQCYAVHGACSEAFYRGHVKRELEERGAERGKARSVQDLLSDTVDLQEALETMRLRELERGAEPTPEEERRALAAARRGDVSLSLWVEWWRTGEGSVVERARQLPPLASLGKARSPSPLLLNSVVDVLYSYAHVCRFFDGEYHADADAAAAMLVEGSPVLRCDARHPTVSAALAAVSERAARTALQRPNHWYAASFVDDASVLIATRDFAAAALLDAADLLQRAADAPKRLEAKLRYLCLWTAHQAPDDALARASAECRDFSQAARPPDHDPPSPLTTTCRLADKKAAVVSPPRIRVIASSTEQTVVSPPATDDEVTCVDELDE